MSWLSRWLHSILDRPKAAPDPPPVSPIPRPAPPGPPANPPPAPPPPISTADWPKRALDIMNARRASRGVGPLMPDDGLAAAAMELALPLGLGQASPHQDFPGRVRRHGWPYEDLGVKSGFGNTSEGISWGGRTPEEAVLILDSSPDPGEGHRRDFEDGHFTHVGIAIVPNGPGRGPMMRTAVNVTVPMTLASAATPGPDDGAAVAPHVAAVAGISEGFMSIGGLVCVCDYGSRRK